MNLLAEAMSATPHIDLIPFPVPFTYPTNSLPFLIFLVTVGFNFASLLLKSASFDLKIRKR